MTTGCSGKVCGGSKVLVNFMNVPSAARWAEAHLAACRTAGGRVLLSDVNVLLMYDNAKSFSEMMVADRADPCSQHAGGP
jgi:hypothetical protein